MNAVFHAQQAVEKTLKALIADQSPDPPPRVHDLPQLAVEAAVWDEMTAEDHELLRKLSRLASLSRYPDASGRSVMLDEATETVEQTEAMCEWLRQRLT
jgi:HEPN domain-containing protein